MANHPNRSKIAKEITRLSNAIRRIEAIQARPSRISLIRKEPEAEALDLPAWRCHCSGCNAMWKQKRADLFAEITALLTP